MKTAPAFTYRPRVAKATRDDFHPHDRGVISPGRLVVLEGVPEPMSRSDFDAAIAFALETPDDATQAILVEHSPMSTVADFIGVACSDPRPGEQRPVFAHGGAFVYAEEDAVARSGTGHSPQWPLGARHSLGMVLARIVTGDPANRWSGWCRANVELGPDGATVLAYSCTACPRTPDGAESTGIVAVVRVTEFHFEIAERYSLTLICTPWGTTRIRQPAPR